jgi:hypothetical protein
MEDHDAEHFLITPQTHGSGVALWRDLSSFILWSIQKMCQLQGNDRLGVGSWRTVGAAGRISGRRRRAHPGRLIVSARPTPMTRAPGARSATRASSAMFQVRLCGRSRIGALFRPVSAGFAYTFSDALRPLDVDPIGFCPARSVMTQDAKLWTGSHVITLLGRAANRQSAPVAGPDGRVLAGREELEHHPGMPHRGAVPRRD